MDVAELDSSFDFGRLHRAFVLDARLSIDVFEYLIFL